MSPEEREVKFQTKLFSMFKECPKYLIPKQKYFQMIDDLKKASETTSTLKSCSAYYLLKKYEIMICGHVEKLIKKRACSSDPPVYYVTIEETFDIIKQAHLHTGHGGRDQMVKELQPKYANITARSIELFKSLCEECQKKRKRPMTKGVVVEEEIRGMNKLKEWLSGAESI